MPSLSLSAIIMIIININTQQQDEQVWMPPLTAITGNGDPNGTPGDETIFIAMATTANSFSNYQDFDNSLNTADTLLNDYFKDGWGYCNPPGKESDGYAYESWDGWSINVKKNRPGFLMHGSTYLANVTILGSDMIRPFENGNLCGGGAIETPGCVSSYGSQNKGEWGCYAADGVDGPKLDTNYFDGEYGWGVTGGVKKWEKESNAFDGVSWIQVDNVRFNDPYSRNIDPNGDYRWVPASQSAFIMPGTPDGSYTHDVYLDNLVSVTTVADGINIGGNAYNVVISSASMQNTGDDAYGFWQNQGDQKLSLMDSNAMNPGVRQHDIVNNKYEPRYGFGSCISFFGCHSAYIDNFECGDRACDSNLNSCSDQNQGHLMTFYPSTWFNGKYDWDPDVCVVEAYNLGWYNIDTNDAISSHEIFYNDDGSERHRDWIARCDASGCWDYNTNQSPWEENGQVVPWVCWDGDCKYVNEWETL